MRPLLLLPLLAACAAPPDLGLPPAGDGTPPPLVPLGPILAAADAPSAPDPGPALAAEGAGLEARAEALRGPVIAGADRERLQQGVDTSVFD